MIKFRIIVVVFFFFGIDIFEINEHVAISFGRLVVTVVFINLSLLLVVVVVVVVVLLLIVDVYRSPFLVVLFHAGNRWLPG